MRSVRKIWSIGAPNVGTPLKKIKDARPCVSTQRKTSVFFIYRTHLNRNAIYIGNVRSEFVRPTL